MKRQILARLGLSAALALSMVLTADGLTSGASAQTSGELVGTFAIAGGQCDGAQVSGSYFRMIHPTGDANGPFVTNGDSSCADQTYTPLRPGTDGGLVTGRHQPAPDPPFDGGGNGLAQRITQPAPFFGVSFATSTEQVDPQTGTGTPPPSIRADGGQLSGSTSAFGAWWNGQTFNQGAPKPSGSTPGNTTPLAGTYDPSTGAYSLTWRSQIEGGPFDDFTGVWHLEGTFRPAGGGGAGPAAQPGSPSPEPATGGNTGGAGASAGSSAGGGGASTGGATADGPDQPVSDADGDSGSPRGAGSATGDGDGAAPADGTLLEGEAVLTQVSSPDDGLEPASWAVVLLGALGIAGVLWLVWLTRSKPDATASDTGS